MADEDIEEIADKFAGKFDAITCSSLYDKTAILQRDLKLSQAMCLLWQNSTTGEVSGRQNDLHLLVGVYCAGLLDLLILDKFTINDVLSTCLCLVSKKKIIEVSVLFLCLPIPGSLHPRMWRFLGLSHWGVSNQRVYKPHFILI